MDILKYAKPFLLTLAINRSHGCDEVLFHYDYCLDMNVLNANRQIPFIEAGKYSALMTITKTDREIDTDDERSYAELDTKTDESREMVGKELAFAELETKTESDRERDDEDDWQAGALAELYTKTEQIRERDDEEFEISRMLDLSNSKAINDMPYFQELFSKTFVDRERDDEDDVSAQPPMENHDLSLDYVGYMV
ncbi:MAG: hypothetical protein IJV15_12390 [Lachnospiraceae bacterium]|nr:hypothetical protein [Lachnospiraceae bacterium]